MRGTRLTEKSQGRTDTRSIFQTVAKLAVLAGIWLALGLAQLFGQANVGSIVGNVTDPTGGVIAGATVTLTNPATGEKQTTLTNNLGDCVFYSVRPATYNILVEYQGFKIAVRENIILHVAEKVSVSFTLEPGAVTQTIEVRAPSPLLQPETSSLGAVIAERAIMDLPLSGRNIYELVKLVPGTSPQFDYGSGQVKQDFFRLSGGAGIALNEISINGGRNLTNEFLLDDVPNTTMGFNGVAIIPPLDAVQEFNVLTNAFSAKYGRSGGGFITAVTKSGTNGFHGTLWEFLRNDNLDANDFFANRSGAKLQEFKQNQFGLTAGGPVRRNKTFFFGSYEGFRQTTGGQLFLTVPTDLQRNGDFSQTFRPDGTLFEIFDPFTTRKDPTTGSFVRDQFMGCDSNTPNVICPDRFDPVAKDLLQFFPEPNLPGAPITHANNFISQAGSNQVVDSFQVRLDHNFTDRQRLFGRFSFDRQHFNPANVLKNIADFNANPFLNRHRGLTLSYTNTINPTTVLNVRYGLVRERQLNNSGSFGFDVTQIGLPASLKAQFEAPVFPRFDIGGFTSLGTQFFSLVDRANTTQTLAANLSKVVGRHSIEAGVDLRMIQGALFQPGWPSGQFAFDAGFTNGPDPFGGAGNGSSFASFLLGTTSFGIGSYDPHWYFTNKYYAFYFQDDIKVSRKLTLNLGLRYDYEAPLEDRHNQLSFVDFQHDIPISVTPVDTSQPDVNTGATVAPGLAASLGLGLSPKPPFRGGAGFPGVGGLGNGVTLPDRNDWGPRVGLAYSITPKTVIRTAYGIIYPGTTADNSGNFPTIQGFNPQTSTLTSPDGLTPFDLPDRAYLLSNPFPNGLRPVDGSRLGLLTSLGSSNTGFLRNDRHAYFQQWNFGIQRELPGNLLVEAAYVGSHSVHLQDYAGVQFDTLADKYLALGNSLFDSLPNPFFGIADPTTTLGASNVITRSQLLMPFPYFTGINGQAGHRTSSTYNGFELRVQKRMSQGLSVLASYTASKALDDDSSTNGWIINVVPRVTGHQNLNNLKLDHSVSAQDRSQILTLSYIYELPFGRGKPLGASLTNPVGSHLISGWQVSSILSFGTGFPLGIACAICAFPANRPNIVGNPNVGIPGSNESRLDRWFNTDAFKVNVPFSYGSTPRLLPNTRSPGQANTDFAIVKNTRFAERYSVQFRAEFFNFLNRPEFDAPDATFGSTTFGVISRQVNTPRQVQFGLKLYW